MSFGVLHVFTYMTINGVNTVHSCQLSRIHREHHRFCVPCGKFPARLYLTDSHGFQKNILVIMAMSVILQQKNVKKSKRSHKILSFLGQKASSFCEIFLNVSNNALYALRPPKTGFNRDVKIPVYGKRLNSRNSFAKKSKS